MNDKNNQMKKKILILYFVISVLTGFSQLNLSSWRQMESDPELMKTLPDQYNKYFTSKFSDTMPSEFKAYLRYLDYWYGRVGLDANDKYSYIPYLEALKGNMTNSICDGSDPADWELMGPSYHPKQQQGLFTEVLYDPIYPDKLLASSNHGGLWKFNPTTNKWYSVTDNLRFPGVSANDLLRNPFDSDTIFAATGNGLWKTEYGLGVLVSADRGETWSVMQSFINYVNDEDPRLVRIIPDPSDTNPNDGLSMYLAGPKNIYYTSNSGKNWQTINITFPLPVGEEIYDMEVSQSGNILISTIYDWGYEAHSYIRKSGVWFEILTEANCFAKRSKFTTPDGNLIYAIKDKIKVKKAIK